ncbi:protein eva-1 homolog C isoform X2 [Tachysurus fulvidraco]|uniref:protein eva-1 homolog C isoform X2 n=1 Tax=Tachysurus fulvidraco TaxID=1234273 RepID=UPI001FF03ADD|nr:protein eva-1 homolog C isoform X2 [Tachysurus fulvidraco]
MCQPQPSVPVKEVCFSLGTKASLNALSWSEYRERQTNKQPRRVKSRPLCDSCIMSRSCSSSLSWYFLGFLLAINSNHAWSAPDFLDFLHTVLKNHTAHACEGETLTIRCPSKTSVAVLSAFYGRRIPSQHLCPNTNKVVSECQDRRACQIPVVSPVFGQDPCPETSKYLLVSYKCRPAHHRLRTVCENEKLRLACKNDTVLAIYSATFGHLKHDTPICSEDSYLKPDIECLSPSALRRVSRKCHGRTNCTVLASVQSFGDPCFPGTSKHLRVSFTCVPRYLLEDMGRGEADPFRISDYTHGGWYTGPGVYRPQNIFTNTMEIFFQIQGLPETVALYFVSGICAGLVFLLCLFGVKSTLVRDVKGLVLDLEDEIKTARRSRHGLINDDNISLDSSFPPITHPYRGANMFNPDMIMTVVVEEKRDEDRDKAEVTNGDIWPHCNFNPYAIHKTKLSSA